MRGGENSFCELRFTLAEWNFGLKTGTRWESTNTIVIDRTRCFPNIIRQVHTMHTKFRTIEWKTCNFTQRRQCGVSPKYKVNVDRWHALPPTRAIFEYPWHNINWGDLGWEHSHKPITDLSTNVSTKLNTGKTFLWKCTHIHAHTHPNDNKRHGVESGTCWTPALTRRLGRGAAAARRRRAWRSARERRSQTTTGAGRTDSENIPSHRGAGPSGAGNTRRHLSLSRLVLFRIGKGAQV